MKNQIVSQLKSMIEEIVISEGKKYHDIFFIEIDASKYGYKSAMDHLTKYDILSKKQE